VTIIRDPSVDDTRKVTNARHEQNSPQRRPPLAAKNQHTSNGAFTRMHRPIDGDELDCPLTIVT
jgi:hypothetical protein